MLHTVLMQNIIYNITILICILRPIYMSSIGTGISFKLYQIGRASCRERV